ncbi:MAG TPA: class I SAM-dependent methyltransferase [Polyangiales bacterium]
MNTTTDQKFDREVWRAVRPYNVGILSLYDVGVYGIWNPGIWQCPSESIKDFYRRHVRDVHLEAGCGTGHLPAHCIPAAAQRGSHQPPMLTLLDYSPSSLKWSARRLRSYQPTLLHHNLFLPLPPVACPFESICLNYVLHCLPGGFEQKQVVIGNLKAVLAPDGILFGSTILGKASASSWRARRMLDLFNLIGSFHNLTDTEAGLRRALAAHFANVRCTVVGSVALFAASDQPLP